MRLTDRDEKPANWSDVIRNRPLDNCYKIRETFIKSRNKVFYNHQVVIINCKKRYVFVNTRRKSNEPIKEVEKLAIRLKSEIEYMIDCKKTNKDFDEWFLEGSWKDWV